MMRKRRLIALIAGGTMVAGGVVAWLNRTAIAENAIDAELEQRGVTARYTIERIGARQQRLRNVVIGNPADPDLIAREMFVTLGYGWTGPYVASVRARGVMLRGRLTDDGLSLGEVDKLLPEPDGTPFEFPDLALDVDDVRARIDTPWGRIGLDATGRGNPAKRFGGALAIAAPQLRHGDCRATRSSGTVTVGIVDGAPTLKGPLGVAALRCATGDLALTDLRFGLDGTIDAAMDGGLLRAGLRGGRGTVSGVSARGLAGRMTVAGAFSGTIDADWELTANNARQALGGAEQLSITGRGKRMRTGALVADGRMSFSGASLSSATQARLAPARNADDSTPVGPLMRRLGSALTAAGQGFSGVAAYTVAGRDAATLSAVAEDVRLVADSGARVDLDGDRAIAWSQRAGLSVEGRADIGGGGLPEGSIRLSKPGPGRGLTGEARFAAYQAGNARIALAPVTFRTDDLGQTRFATRVALSGPLGDGFVEGLSLPLSGSFAASGSGRIDGDCRSLRWQTIAIGGVRLDPAAVQLCAIGNAPLMSWSAAGLRGGATLPGFAITGRTGNSALRLTGDGGSIDLSGGGFALRGLDVRIGEGDSTTLFAAASLSGRRAGGGFAGRLAGGNGKIGPTPFLLSDADGEWQWRDGALRLETALSIDDAAPEDRFQRLRGDGVVVTYARDVVRAEGRLNESVTGTAVADVRIQHRFGSGTGDARFTVPAIAFAREGLQPVDLTRLALGVVASVEGRVNGSGTVRWTPEGTTSSGRFATDRLDLAAAFGPVERLSGTIMFDDLIALSTPPGQVVRLGSVNPGIEVLDGVLRYQLLPGQRVRIEEGRWLFAGGNLLLQPALLDFSAEHPRYLTFDVSDVDAAQFLQRYEFDNLTATGIFDGVLPTVFDGDGGRVLGGSLVSRDGGGTIAYVGELSNRDLGTMANIAYGALKSLRYDNLVIRLNGNIDGEMLTEVDFTGLAQGEGAERNFLTRAIAELPFSFRIRINAPFRQLLTSARGLYDPTILIDQNLPGLLRAEREAAAARNAPAVQP